MRLTLLAALASVFVSGACIAESIQILDCEGNLKAARVIDEQNVESMLLQFENVSGSFSVTLAGDKGQRLVKSSETAELMVENPSIGRWTVCTSQPSARLVGAQFNPSGSTMAWGSGAKVTAGGLAGAGVIAAAFAMNDGSSSQGGDSSSALAARRPSFVPGRRPAPRNPSASDCLNNDEAPELSPFE